MSDEVKKSDETHLDKEEIVTVNGLWFNESDDGKFFHKLNLQTVEYGVITCKTVRNVPVERTINGILRKKLIKEFVGTDESIPDCVAEVAKAITSGSVRVRVKWHEWNKDGKTIRYIRDYFKISLVVIGGVQ